MAEPQRAQGYYAAFLGDARFQVLATATSGEDARAKLAMEPEVVVVEATVFESPNAFVQLFGASRTATFVLLPADVAPSHVDVIRRVGCVRDTLVGEVNFVTLAGQIFAAIQSQRQAVLMMLGILGGIMLLMFSSPNIRQGFANVTVQVVTALAMAAMAFGYTFLNSMIDEALEG